MLHFTTSWVLHGSNAKGGNAAGIHVMRFVDGFMLLTDSQLANLGSMLNVNGDSVYTLPSAVNTNHIRKLMNLAARRSTDLELEPCSWNMLLRRRCDRVVATERVSCTPQYKND